MIIVWAERLESIRSLPKLYEKAPAQPPVIPVFLHRGELLVASHSVNMRRLLLLGT